MLMTIAPPCRDVHVALAGALSAFGGHVTARLSGPSGAPLVVAMGGISADRFVCSRQDGAIGWWPGLVGAGAAVDPARFRILGLDFAADPSGALAPSTRCQAEVLCAALDAIDAPVADLVLGASYGGMVALALAEHHPGRVRKLAVISAPATPHPASTAVRELQRRVVALGRECGRSTEALSIARGMAMLTYRTREEFAERFAGGIDGPDPLCASSSGAYLRARGDAYPAVMSPERFLSLSASIDRHRIEPSRIAHPAILIGATSDLIVPPEQMRALAAALPAAELQLLDCRYGHDMFLKEAGKIGHLLQPVLAAL